MVGHVDRSVNSRPVRDIGDQTGTNDQEDGHDVEKVGFVEAGFGHFNIKIVVLREVL
jgi:hypothetical protein